MLDDLKSKVARGEIEVSEHATKQLIRRNIAATEIAQAVATAQLLEDYPDAQHGPCCLNFGRTAMNRAPCIWL